MEEEHRSREVEVIYNALTAYAPIADLPIKLVRDTAKNIERSVNRVAIEACRDNNIPTYWENADFVAKYSSVGYNILVNIDVTSSVLSAKAPEVKNYFISKIYHMMALTDVLGGTIPAEVMAYVQSYCCDLKTIASLSALDLNPAINRPYIEELERRGQEKIDIKFSTMYLCDKCKKRKTKERELQTRSGDEGGTLFIECLHCGYVWKQNS